MCVEVVAGDGSKALEATIVFGANIIGCHMILGTPWLKKTNPKVSWPKFEMSFTKWPKENLSFPNRAYRPFAKEAASMWAQVTGVYDVSTPITPAISPDISNTNPVVG